MDKYLSSLAKLKFSVILLVFGFIFILGGFYQIENLTVSLSSESNFVFLGIGVLSIGFAIWIEISIERSPEEITKRAAEITGRRFANLIYLYAKKTNTIALGRHEKIGYLPPGRRLEVFELPDEEVIEIIRDQMGIEVVRENFIFPVINPQVVSHTDENGQTEGKVDIRLSPIWMQLETHPNHRNDKQKDTAVVEHLDFIFLCIIDNERPLESGSRADCGWFGRDKLIQMIKPGHKRKIPIDVLRGFDAIQQYLGINSA